MNKKYITSILLSTIIVTSISACNSGSSNTASNSQPTPSAPSYYTPVGLKNLGNSCYMNAALQIIIHNPYLRNLAIEKNPNGPFKDFFVEYDKCTINSNNCDNLYRAQLKIADYIYQLSGQYQSGLPNDPLNVLEGDRYTFTGLQLTTNVITNLTQFVPRKNQLYSFYTQYNSATIAYKALPTSEQINSFIYFTKGHYVTYLKENKIWYLIDDSKVLQVSEADLQTLSVNSNSGVTVVVYN